MNVQPKRQALVPETVTTGPLTGSRKIYHHPQGRADIAVPFREIALDPAADEPPVRVYDASGPYTEADARIDLSRGLPPIREAWIGQARRHRNPWRTQRPARGQRRCLRASGWCRPARRTARRGAPAPAPW